LHIAGRYVKDIVKFTKEEIVFTCMEWNEDKKGREKNVEATYKLVPTKSFVKSYVL